MKKVLIFILILMVLLTSCEKSNLNIETKLYKEIEDNKLYLDIYHPTNYIYKKSPALIYIHGGGWISGSRDALLYGERKQLVEELRKQGYTIITIDYRLLDNNTHFPENEQDCADAINYIIENSDSLNIDSNRIGLWGSSAGGHLALINGLKLEDEISYIIDFFGPTDFTTLFNIRNSTFRSRSKAYTGYDYKDLNKDILDEFLVINSPITYVTSTSPSVLILHGKDDQTVPISQSETLIDSYENVSNPNIELITVNDVEHGILTNKKLTKSFKDDLVNQIIEFIKQF